MSLLRALQRDGRDHRWDDVLAAVVVATAVVVLATGADVDALAPRSHPDLLTWVATIGIGLTVLGRRRWPLRSLAVACALLLVLGAGDSGDTVRFLAWIILVYSAGAHLPRRPALGAAAMVVVLAIVSHVLYAADPSTGLVGAGAAFGLGRLIRRRRADQAAQATAARLHATAVVETAELAAAADRQRMAQELHDVVAHSLSVIAVQAGIGAHLIVRQPAEAARALDAIRMASDAAGGELARLVELLRDGDAGRSEPAPSLTHVPALCEQVAATGVPTELVVEGDVGAVPSGVSLAAYRIVQEALTNVVRHAGPATAAVTVRVFADHVQLGIDDDGAGAPTPTEPDRTGPGHG
ncbi:MAG: histidine kinase, partial [Ilumatobacteraceae bacterium]